MRTLSPPPTPSSRRRTPPTNLRRIQESELHALAHLVHGARRLEVRTQQARLGKQLRRVLELVSQRINAVERLLALRVRVQVRPARLRALQDVGRRRVPRPSPRAHFRELRAADSTEVGLLVGRAARYDHADG